MTVTGNNSTIQKIWRFPFPWRPQNSSKYSKWSGTDVSNEGKQEKIKEELADVLNYCVLMADACGLDIDEIVQEKIKVNNEKYPVSKAKGKKEKYNKL